MKILRLLFISLFLYTGQLIAQCPSIANFTYSISGTEVTVTNTSHVDDPIYNQVRFYWEFPEGGSSNQQFTTDTSTIVKHTYGSVGNHWITLLMHDSLSNCYDTASTYIYIPCATDFTYSVHGNTVYFQDQSIDTLSYTHWNFGDQSYSNNLHPSHTYASAGQYQVCHVVMNTLCMDSICKTITVGDTSCQAGFSYFLNGNTIYISDRSSGALSMYYEFGSPTDTTTVHNPSYTFDTTGTYVICQNIYNYLNGCTDTYCDTIVVPNNNCNASFTQIADSTQLFTIQILNNSSNASTHSYLWDFGDDSTSTDRNPTHEYQAFGSYVVCLTITDSILNCISTFCDTLGMDSNGVLFKGSFTLEVMDSLLVGIKDKTESTTFNLFPNPAKDQLNISSSEMNPGMSEIKILNIQGKEVLYNEVSFNDGHCIIELDHLPAGVYFLKMQGAEKEIVKKFIKQ